jgi:DNA-binding transcriptional MerR regulator
MEGFTAVQAARLTGVPYARLDYWARTGFLRPTIAQSRGRGHARLYSFRDLVALKTAMELRKLGVSLQALRRVVRYLRKLKGLEHPLAQARLVVVGNDVALVEDEQQLVSMLKAPGQAVWRLILDLPALVAELRREVDRLGRTAA